MNAPKALISSACTTLLLALMAACATPDSSVGVAPNEGQAEAGLGTRPAPVPVPAKLEASKPEDARSATGKSAAATNSAASTPPQPAFDLVIKGA